MKNTYLTIGFFLIFTACKKDDPLADNYWGTVEATKNGENWEARVAAREYPLDDGDYTLEFDSYTKDGFHIGQLTINKIPFREDTFPVISNGKVEAKFFVVEVDALLQVYRIADNDSTSYLSITKLNNDEIIGNFDVIFHRDTNFTIDAEKYPDTYRFSSKEFHTKIINF